jgi:DNA mismatch repair ATPase MutS
MPDLIKLYSTRIEIYKKELLHIRKQLAWINTGRLVFFLILLISPFKIYPLNHILGIVVPVISLIIFLILVKRNVAVISKKKFLENLVLINKNEIDALSHQFSIFDPGTEFIDPDHINSYDLDLFGKGSLFQFVNRTITFKGKIRLAEMFQNPLTNKDKLKLRQGLIAELASDYDWRQNFTASGMMYAEDKAESELFDKWGNERFQLKLGKNIKLLLVILPIFSILSILYWIIAGNSALFILAALIQLAVWLTENKNIKTIYALFGKRVSILSKYASLLEKIEKRSWKSTEGKSVVEVLSKKGLPSKEISALKSIISAFDNRNNMLIGIILNLVFAWDVLCTFRLIRWHEKNKENYKRWDSTLAFFDAINSFSNFAFNHAEYAFPEFTEGKFHLEATAMGHPLIHPQKRVANNFSLKGNKQLAIVTGANMAGKSTFLRTVGVNMVFGMNGAPVCAEKMEFTPVEVFSNMRTTDSLFDDESYFFAELKRIKSILVAIEKGRPILIILDEILKGTNSIDKLAGSQKLLKRLVGQKAPAIIATHDLKLTEMEAEYPDYIQNNCFEIIIENNEMQFDYTLRDGVTKMMNATFLMKKMGIID